MIRRPVTAVFVALAACLAGVSPAHAAQFLVTGGGDAATPPPCVPENGFFTCTTLRAAVLEANQSVEQHGISLQPSAVTLSAGPLPLSSDIIISGAGARQTSVSGAGTQRVFDVASGATVVLANMTIRDGFSSGTGGNIFVAPNGTLSLLLVRVTGGRAINGAGVTNNGDLSVQLSLFDDNASLESGGAIFNTGPDNIAETQILSSTLAGNAAPVGAAIYSAGLPQNTVRLVHATVGRNLVGSAIEFGGTQNAFADGSILASNAGANCAGATFTGTGNVDSGSTCGLAGAGNLQNTDPGLAAALSQQGASAQTDLLTIPAGSAAIDLVNPCVFPVDQRGWARITAGFGACDAGAFELSAVDPGGQPPPEPLPPTPTPIPTPTPTPTPTPEPPVFRQTVGVTPVSGTVEICPPRQTCRPLRSGETIPMGSTIDTRKGRVELTSLSSAGGAPQKAQFYDGLFRVTQNGAFTELTLTEKLARCSTRARAAQSKKPKARRLWGDGKGKFRTKGQYAAATVRGTSWLTQDTCAGTLIRVTQGSVNVRDIPARKTVVVRKGKRYLARARR